ncbi:unnamed protein product [Caenorhabditis bovis]|uniref:Calponin-homology (CH) domain-containing protein n=1 Tax=Caenorhabditis bovis TaxID=2654633 RepID=A0A8S1EWC6_9PELO|nr:unnamed protein product [Caenorhabditis bovis]
MVVNVFISAVTTDNLSRKEAIAWVNDTLKTHLTKVEEMSTGACYCQLTHYLFRDGINLKKVKFNPRNEPEILANWKLLTTSWKTLGIDKPVDVEKLKKGKFQDNMEFLQWFFKFFNANLGQEDPNYDPVAARGGEEIPALKGSIGGPARPAPAARPAAVTRITRPAQAASPATRITPKAQNVLQPSAQPNNSALLAEIDELRKLLKEKETEIADWMESSQDMEQERDAYYGILRKVEDLVNETEKVGSTSISLDSIKDVLFSVTRMYFSIEQQLQKLVQRLAIIPKLVGYLWEGLMTKKVVEFVKSFMIRFRRKRKAHGEVIAIS